MELHLKNKTALITGASYGLGFACAMELAREGVRIMICSRDTEALSRAAEEIQDTTRTKVHTVSADLTNLVDLNNLSSEAERLLGPIDILVVSTGHPPTYSFSMATDAHWDLGNKLILQPAINLTRAVLPGMRKRGYGRLIYIGSIFGLEPEQSSIVQSTLRTGLNAFSKCIATEAAADGVTANVICPGYFKTPLVTNLAGKYAQETGQSLDQVLDSWRSASPTHTFGDPEDLGCLVTFIASPKGAFINGTSVVIDGGALKSY